jgi:hypothetical protein
MAYGEGWRRWSSKARILTQPASFLEQSAKLWNGARWNRRSGHQGIKFQRSTRCSKELRIAEQKMAYVVALHDLNVKAKWTSLGQLCGSTRGLPNTILLFNLRISKAKVQEL